MSTPLNLSPQQKHWRWRIFLLTWLAYAGFYLTRKGFSVAKKPLMAEYGFTKPELAAVDTAYNVAYAIGMFGFGMLADKIGTRKVVLTGMLISIVAGALMGVSHALLVFGLLYGIQGIVQSTGWGPLAKNLSQFFGTRERGLIMGIWCTNYSLGGVIATNLAGVMAKKSGWPAAFWVPALVLFGIWLLFLLFQKNTPEEAGIAPIDDSIEEEASDSDSPSVSDGASGGNPILEVLRNPMVLLLCGVYFAIKPIRYLFLQWGPLYIADRLGTDVAESAIVSTAFEIGGPFGAIAAGWISDKLLGARRVPVCVVCLIAVAICLSVFGLLPPSALVVGVVLGVMGFFLYGVDSLVTGVAAVDFGSKRGAATAAGVINGSGSIGQILGGLLPALVGEKPSAWNPLFWTLAVGVVLAAIALIPKWNSRPTK